MHFIWCIQLLHNNYELKTLKGAFMLNYLIQLCVVCMYEVKDEKTGTTLIAMQPLVADQAYMPQMKAMCVPFHMVYGRLMCY